MVRPRHCLQSRCLKHHWLESSESPRFRLVPLPSSVGVKPELSSLSSYMSSSSMSAIKVSQRVVFFLLSGVVRACLIVILGLFGTVTGSSCFSYLPCGLISLHSSLEQWNLWVTTMIFSRSCHNSVSNNMPSFFMTDIVMPAQICFGVSNPVPFHNIMAPIRTHIYV